MWLCRVQATMHQPAGLTLQHTVLPGTSFFSDFSLLLSFASYLNTSQQFSPPPLFSVTLFPPSVPKYADTSLLRSHKSHEKEIPNNSASLHPCIPPFTQHLLSNTFSPINFPLPFSTPSQRSTFHLFSFFSPLCFLSFSRSVSPMPLKRN